MVLNESEVLPRLFLDEEDEESRFVLRLSRAHLDNNWLDEDHYFEDDTPVDTFDAEWYEKYKDFDEIQVNGALKRQ